MKKIIKLLVLLAVSGHVYLSSSHSPVLAYQAKVAPVHEKILEKGKSLLSSILGSEHVQSAKEWVNEKAEENQEKQGEDKGDFASNIVNGIMQQGQDKESRDKMLDNLDISDEHKENLRNIE